MLLRSFARRRPVWLKPSAALPWSASPFGSSSGHWASRPLRPGFKSPSGWLWAWAFAIESTSKNKAAATEFVKWATSKDYATLVNQKTGGWGGVPSGARKSLYDVAGYKDYAKAFGPIVVDSLNTVDPLHATNYPDTPYTGIQFVQIQEFQDLGTKCTQEFAAAISGSEATTDAINKCQQLAEDVATSGGYK